MSTIYKHSKAKEEIMELYEEKLQSLGIEYEEIDVPTQFGNTRIVKTGNRNGQPVVLLHGFNAGAPLTLEAVKEITDQYLFYAIDTIGQATKSDEVKMNIKDDSFAVWVDEVLEQLQLPKANFIGISYGAFILQKVMVHRPQRIDKCILVVPSGLVKGSTRDALTKLTFPLIRYKLSKSDVNLKKFLNAFVPEDNEFLFRLLKTIMTGIKLDTRIPALAKQKDLAHFGQPVYIIGAEEDVYFPGSELQKTGPTLFSNLKEVHLLKGSKHMPAVRHYPEIQEKLKEWMG